ncbi:MAG: hypothetical protein U1E15_11135 [Hyphomicrobiales bacterium]
MGFQRGQQGFELQFLAQANEGTHPADSLALALSRAEGVLSALVACHDSERGGFVVADQFVLQSIAAIDNLIADARSAHAELCARCDLSLLAKNTAPSLQEQEDRAPEGLSEMTADILPPLPLVENTGEPHVAQSYDDLLRKLTAAEVFAAETSSVSETDTSLALLPLLRRLRQDLERLRAA